MLTIHEPGEPVRIDYTNHRGERSVRRVHPFAIRWGTNDWHPRAQWLLEAMDLEKNAQRTFAMKDIHGWAPDGPATEDAPCTPSP